MEQELPDDQFFTFSHYRTLGWEQVGKDGELVHMRKNVSSNPNVKSYEYMYITPDGKVRKR
jgi:hypothetical protein